MRVRIYITKDVLKRSAKCDSKNNKQEETKIGQNCAVGMAINKLFGEKGWVDGYEIQVYTDKVTYKDGFITHNGIFKKIYLPDSAQEFIREFDQSSPTERRKMPELNFEIDIPEEVIDLLGREKALKAIKDSCSLELIKKEPKEFSPC